MLLHHVALGARDVDRVAGFYRDLLGLPEVTRHSGPGGLLRSVWLDLGGATLMIERTDGPPRPVDAVAAGPFLIAMRATPAEVPRLVAALAAAGTRVEGRTEHTVYFRDPEGNRVALSAHPAVLDDTIMY